MTKKPFQSEMEKSSPSGPVGSFAAELEKAKVQIITDRFSGSDRAQAEEIAALIAEMKCLPGDALVTIAGAKIPASTVSEIYGRLEHEHVRSVIDRIAEIYYPVKRVKTYLRTALYNAVFEFEFRIQNEYNQNEHGEQK